MGSTGRRKENFRHKWWYWIKSENKRPASSCQLYANHQMVSLPKLSSTHLPGNHGTFRYDGEKEYISFKTKTGRQGAKIIHNSSMLQFGRIPLPRGRNTMHEFSSPRIPTQTEGLAGRCFGLPRLQVTWGYDTRYSSFHDRRNAAEGRGTGVLRRIVLFAQHFSPICNDSH